MKRILFVTLIYLLTIFWNPLYSQSMLKDWNFKTHRQYVKQAETISYDNICFEIERDFYVDGEKSYTEKYDIHIIKNDKQPLLYCIQDSTYSFRLTNKQMMCINHVNCEVSIFDDVRNKNSFYNQIGINEVLSKVFTDIPYYIHYLKRIEVPMGIFFLISSKNDTTIYGKNHIIYEGYHDGYFYNDSTCNYDNYIRTKIYNVIDTETNMLNYAYSVKNIDGLEYETYTYIKNVSLDKSKDYFESMFNNKLYSKYSFHDENNPPYSMISSSEDNIQESVTSYPLISLNNDSTYLKDKNSWILLNLWSLNCPSCIENISKYKHEKDSLGYRILENEGIEILAINYHTDNMDLIRNMAEKTNSTDIMYSAKGINAHISIPSLGYYYLISPDKKVVFKDYKLGNYSELIKAKEEYGNKNK